MAVAALADPPPSPAWAGTLLTRSALKKLSPLEVFRRINSKALTTRLVESVGTPGMLHVNSSLPVVPSSSVFRGSSDRVSVSPKPTAWKRDARS